MLYTYVRAFTLLVKLSIRCSLSVAPSFNTDCNRIRTTHRYMIAFLLLPYYLQLAQHYTTAQVIIILIVSSRLLCEHIFCKSCSNLLFCIRSNLAIRRRICSLCALALSSCLRTCDYADNLSFNQFQLLDEL